VKCASSVISDQKRSYRVHFEAIDPADPAFKVRQLIAINIKF